MAEDVLLVAHHHFDTVWRRCFDRPAIRHGIAVQSYTEVQGRVMDAWLRLAPGGYTFSEGQAAVWRRYLAGRPDRAGAVAAEARAGRLCVMLAGETVQDTNLSTAEGLVRNFLAAMPLYREMVGEDHPGLRLAWLEDAFGTSPNYPQVLRGVGAEVACATSYRVCEDAVWVGLDGTALRCYDPFPWAGHVNAPDKHAPCAACHGMGCEACDCSGMEMVTLDLEEVRRALETALAAPGETAVVVVGGEEVLPAPGLGALVDERNATLKGKARIRWGTPLDIYKAFRPALEDAETKRETTPTPELNPAMPGCAVTRIRNKQRTRAAAYRLAAAEARLANRSWAAGRPEPMPEDLTEAWRRVVFNQFHDAITGTHIDAANTELMEMLDEAEVTSARYLPPAPPAERPGPFATADAGSIRLGAIDVAFDRRGIISAILGGRDLFGQTPFRRGGRSYRIGELVLEADFGDAWGQRIPACPDPRNDLSQVLLGDHHHAVETAGNAIRWHGRYRGGDPKVRALSWTVTVRASDDGRRLDFTTEVDWDTESRRLRAVFPVASGGRGATYEVPFGFVERAFEPEKIEYGQRTANTMEFPALHWVRKEIDADAGVALLNRGLPCHRWMPGRLDISLLRSPEWAFCAVEPAFYEFWDIDGQRDTGKHRFEYAAWPYADGLSPGDLTREGYRYNAPDSPPPPFDIRGDVVVTAWKPAEDGSGWILRLQEAAGTGTDVALEFREERNVTRVDLLERPQEGPKHGRRYTATLHAHGILTLHIR